MSACGARGVSWTPLGGQRCSRGWRSRGGRRAVAGETTRALGGDGDDDPDHRQDAAADHRRRRHFHWGHGMRGGGSSRRGSSRRSLARPAGKPHRRRAAGAHQLLLLLARKSLPLSGLPRFARPVLLGMSHPGFIVYRAQLAHRGRRICGSCGQRVIGRAARSPRCSALAARASREC